MTVPDTEELIPPVAATSLRSRYEVDSDGWTYRAIGYASKLTGPLPLANAPTAGQAESRSLRAEVARDPGLLVARLYQFALVAVVVTVLAATVVPGLVPLLLAVTLAVVGATELVAFVLGETRRLGPVAATALALIGVLGVLLYLVALLT